MNPTAILPPLDSSRVREIAGFLGDRKTSLAPSRKDRSIWNEFGTSEGAAKNRILALAEEFLSQPISILTDRQYLEARQTDGRNGYSKHVDHRRVRVTVLTLAEALENGGRFLSAINREISAICDERIWSSPRHDWNRVNYEGIRIDVDLISAMTAWSLATADTMLDEGLEPDVRQAIRRKIRQTVTGPYLAAIRGFREEEWWTRNEYNWNPVVHAGIIGAALLLTDDYSTDETAELISGAEQGLPYYLRGFGADGYSSEGIGYWRYGFGHYALLAEIVLEATGGQLSFYASDHARLIANFPERFEMSSRTHFYPPFSDARYPEPHAPWLSYFLDQRYGLGRNIPRVVMPEGDFTVGFFSTFLHAWGVTLRFNPKLISPWTGSGTSFLAHRLRDWFYESQILVSRLPEKERGMNLSLKGGNNGVNHCHHDLGSFIVTVDDVPVLADPGVTDYGPGTFGPDRFKNQIMGSYGHSVPLIAGQWQGVGSGFFAVVTETDFTDDADRITFDLTKGYSVPSLKFLQRRFEYIRNRGGTLTVSDHVEFDSPQKFGTAIVTYGEAREERPGIWIVTKDGASVRIEIDAGKFPFTVTDEILRDESRVGKVRRLGIDLLSPVDRAEIRVRITPHPSSSTPFKTKP